MHRGRRWRRHDPVGRVAAPSRVMPEMVVASEVQTSERGRSVAAAAAAATSGQKERVVVVGERKAAAAAAAAAEAAAAVAREVVLVELFGV